MPTAKFDLSSITDDEVTELGLEIGINWDTAKFDTAQFRKGIEIELEHGSHDPETDVTGDDPEVTAKLAWAHLKELPDYYTRLEKIEK